MKRQVNNTRKCIECSLEVPRKVMRCPDCNKKFLQLRPTYSRTEEHKRKMSEVTKGKPKQHRSASENPEVAVKIQNWWTEERREAARQRGLRFALDPEWRLKIALSVSGASNPRWEDGRSGKAYSPGFADKVRELVRERDGNQCTQCGSTKHLCVHHKDFEKVIHDLDNLVLLCRKCHTIEHVEHSKSKSLKYSTTTSHHPAVFA